MPAKTAKTHGTTNVAGLGRLKLVVDRRQTPQFAIGDRVCGMSSGLVVGIDDDAIVVARRNAKGRCMEVVFVGATAKTLQLK